MEWPKHPLTKLPSHSSSRNALNRTPGQELSTSAPEPLEDRAKGHKECRTRGEALDFYGDPKNQKDGLSSKQLKLIAGALDQSALQLLGYDCPDAVQRWAKKVDDDLGEKSHQDRVTDLAPRQFRQFAAMEQTMASFNFFRNLQLTSSPARFQATRLSEMASRLLPIRGLATDAEPGDFSDVMKFCAGGSRSPTSGSPANALPWGMG
ncbi:unnamed protein product [Symbiodinium microadriaticum]|nr:unnamed protein product [Symbiodinium microadriaticum]